MLYVCYYYKYLGWTIYINLINQISPILGNLYYPLCISLFKPPLTWENLWISICLVNFRNIWGFGHNQNSHILYYIFLHQEKHLKSLMQSVAVWKKQNIHQRLFSLSSAMDDKKSITTTLQGIWHRETQLALRFTVHSL